MQKDLRAIGDAFVKEFQQMMDDGRLPKIDISQFKSAEELAAYAINAVRTGGKTMAEAVKGAIPHDPSKKQAAFQVTPGGAKPEPDEDPEADGFDELAEQVEEGVRDQVGKMADVLDGLEKRYHDLVRSRAFIHGVRDLPDMDNPDHLASMVDILNSLELISHECDGICRKLAALGEAYGLGDTPAVDCLLDRLADLDMKLVPLMGLFHEKLDNAVGEDWDPCVESCEGCDGCCGCEGDCEDCGPCEPPAPVPPNGFCPPMVLAFQVGGPKPIEPETSAPTDEGTGE